MGLKVQQRLKKRIELFLVNSRWYFKRVLTSRDIFSTILVLFIFQLSWASARFQSSTSAPCQHRPPYVWGKPVFARTWWKTSGAQSGRRINTGWCDINEGHPRTRKHVLAFSRHVRYQRCPGGQPADPSQGRVNTAKQVPCQPSRASQVADPQIAVWCQLICPWLPSGETYVSVKTLAELSCP